MVIRLSYLHNGISYAGKMTSLLNQPQEHRDTGRDAFTAILYGM